MEFISDIDVIGKWKNIGWLEDLTKIDFDNLNDKDGEFEDIYFLPNGEPYWIFEGWTKNTLYIHYGGDEPILSYNYEIKNKNGKKYLLLYFEEKVEVFIQINDNIYSKETLGNHDNIDLPFVFDEKIIGSWRSVGFVDEIENFNPSEKYDGLYLKSIDFFTDGNAIQHYSDEDWHDKWTNGFLINLHRATTAAYEIKTVDGFEFLFLEWKMGNYIYGGQKPKYYVFSKL